MHPLRWVAAAVAGLAAGAASAGEVTGAVTILGRRPAELRAGYVGVTNAGENRSCFAGATLSSTRGSVVCTTYKPRISVMEFDPAGIRFRHERVDPGTYFVYVRAGDTATFGRRVTVAAGQAKVSVPIQVDLRRLGALNVAVARTGKPTNVMVCPAQARGAPHSPDPWTTLGQDKDVGKGPVLFSGLAPGWYAVSLRTVHRETSQGGSWAAFEDMGAWSVEIKPGRLQTIPLP
ncbi:MAG: hypothetical protein NT029_05815 [Armatimonadetes bacterium]|nr:hypothetical protein [Armatimonadota bacterium]